MSSIEFNRLQSAVIQQNLRDVGIESDVRSYEFATLYADILKGNFQMYTLQWVGGALADPDILRRVFHSQQVPPGGIQSRPLQRSRSRSTDRRSDARHATTRSAARSTEKCSSGSPKLAPYISLWHETNIALAQPTLQGIRLSPQGDFSFLRNVSR